VSSFKTVVLCEHNDLKVYIYQTPCGIQTYYRNRKRHNWSWKGTAGERQDFGEDFQGASQYARQNGGHVLLELDGVPLRKDQA
jgi:hypothetical protein